MQGKKYNQQEFVELQREKNKRIKESLNKQNKFEFKQRQFVNNETHQKLFKIEKQYIIPKKNSKLKQFQSGNGLELENTLQLSKSNINNYLSFNSSQINMNMNTEVNQLKNQLRNETSAYKDGGLQFWEKPQEMFKMPNINGKRSQNYYQGKIETSYFNLGNTSQLNDQIDYRKQNILQSPKQKQNGKINIYQHLQSLGSQEKYQEMKSIDYTRDMINQNKSNNSILNTSNLRFKNKNQSQDFYDQDLSKIDQNRKNIKKNKLSASNIYDSSDNTIQFDNLIQQQSILDMNQLCIIDDEELKNQQRNSKQIKIKTLEKKQIIKFKRSSIIQQLIHEKSDDHQFNIEDHTFIKDIIKQSFSPRKKMAQVQENDSDQFYSELKKLTTGIQSVEFFLANASGKNSGFIYCIRKIDQRYLNNQYDLITLSDQELAKKYYDYYIITIQGIFHFFTQQGVNYFNKNYDIGIVKQSLQEWMVDYSNYKKFHFLSKQEKVYLLQNRKVFWNLERNVTLFLIQDHKIKSCILNKFKKSKCLWASKKYRENILKVINNLNNLKGINFVTQKLEQLKKSWELNDFLNEQRIAQTENISFFNTELKSIVVDIITFIKEIAKEYDKQKLISVKHQPVNKLVPLFKNKALVHNKQKLIQDSKYHYDKIITYIKTLQHQCHQILFEIVLNSMKYFEKQIQTYQKFKKGLFNFTVKFSTDYIQIIPDLHNFQQFFSTFFCEFQQIFSSINKIISHEYLYQYIPKYNFNDLSEILSNNQCYQNIKKNIFNSINLEFEEVQQYVDKNVTQTLDIEDDYILWKNNFNRKLIDQQELSVEYSKQQLIQIEFQKNRSETLLIDFQKVYINLQFQKIQMMYQQHYQVKQDFYKQKLYDKMQQKQNKSKQIIQNYLQKLSQNPQNLDKYNEILQNLNDLKDYEKDIQQNIHEIQLISYLIRQYDITKIKDEDYILTQDILNEYQKLENAKEKSKIQILNNTSQNQQELLQEIQIIQQKVEGIIQNLDQGKITLSDQSEINMKTVLNKAGEVNLILAEQEKEIKKLRQRQEQIQQFSINMNNPIENNQILTNLEIKFKDRKLIWDNIQLFNQKKKEWTENLFSQIDIEEVESQIRFFDFSNQQLKLRINNLTEKGLDKQLDFLISEIKEFHHILPIILSLGNKDLQETHWKQLEEQIDEKINQKKFFTLKELITDELLEKKDQLMEISQKATGQQIIQNQIKNIKNKWDNLNFVVAQIDDSPNKLKIISIDDIIQTLDDHQVQIQGIMSTRYVQEIRQDTEIWQNKLLLISQVIDEWLALQRNWIYLENIFNAQDIQRQMPQESNQFSQVNKFWLDLMNRAKKFPSVYKTCNNQELLIKLQNNNLVLESIQKCLDQYLNSKRVGFPRFYFLSNDELLEVLSQTKNPQNIQPHLRKCFDNINKIEFLNDHQSDSQFVIAMISSEPERMPERVPFDSFIRINVGDKVENFMSNIQKGMVNTLKEQTINVINNFDSLQYRDWIFQKKPAQCILVVQQIKWQENIVQAIQNNYINSLQQSIEQQSQQLDILIQCVKQNLNILEQQLICNLLIINVHLKDITKLLLQDNVDSLENFSWDKQLRYYYNDYEIKVNQTIAKLSLSYEYLGNSTRLVVTNLTDKCYLTMTMALQLKMGGNPNGPAGTGKTETIKDLGKALQIKCLVFNCSDSLDYKTMGRFFSGICQCGNWVCFDEFNRIGLDVLSVIAQQIQNIQKALKSEQDQFMFEDYQIKIINKLGIFITSNPTYAGRQELPDNLKQLFRPVAMIIPDFQQISEIILMSDGFLQARVLGQKIVQLYKICSETLSNQVHYDFGLRAIKSVILLAGKYQNIQNLLNQQGQKRRKEQEENYIEEKIIVESILDNNLPKFLKTDLEVFQGILQDLFPDCQIIQEQNQTFINQINDQFEKENMQSDKLILEKIFQIKNTLEIRVGIMLVGYTGSGKTTILKILKKTFDSLYKLYPQDPNYFPIQQTTINPKAVNSNSLYGYVNFLTNEWHDGIISKVIRQASNQQQNNENDKEKFWIVLDGPVDTIWAENLNATLDDNKILCLSNGQRIKLSTQTQLIFEVDNLSEASPATVSRCGMVYVDLYQDRWRQIIMSWSQKFQQTYFFLSKQNKDQIKNSSVGQNFNMYLRKMVNLYNDNQQYFKTNCKQFIEASQIQQIQSMLNIAEALYQELIKFVGDLQKLNKKTILEIEHYFNMILVISFTWGIGGNFYNQDAYQGQANFDGFIKQKFSTIYPSLPMEYNIYDLYINFQEIRLRNWSHIIPSFKFDKSISFFNIIVPTVETMKYLYLIDLQIKYQKNTLITGNSGVGKSIIIQQYLKGLDFEKCVQKQINFSAQTNTQNLLDTFTDKDKFVRKKKDLIGAPFGKQIIIFIDDINMPMLDQFGSQPPIEFLRQLIGNNGFYDNKKIQFVQIQDCTFLTACAPPGGGRHAVTPRFSSQFSIIWMTQLQPNTLEYIYIQILQGFLKENPKDNTSNQAKKIVQITINVYKQVLERLLPIPSKCHYIFNPKDVAKVFQGILQIKYDQIQDTSQLLMLWLYEFQRIFKDRLSNQFDRDVFVKFISDQLQQSEMITHLHIQDFQNIIYTDLNQEVYQQIENYSQLDQFLIDNLGNYNQQNKKMNLVFFKEAILQIIYICRIIKIERGNAILIGLGGSGRNSLTKLCTFIRQYEIFQIQITNTYNDVNWKDDLRKLLKQAGANNIQTVLILSDNNIQKESYLEDINNILNTGEVPNLMALEDQEEIYSELRLILKEKGIFESKENMQELFIQLVRENLHIVIAFSPVGPKLRNRCREFPSIISGSTIIWFDKWPNEALNQLALRELQAQEQIGIGHHKSILARSMVDMNFHVLEYAQIFYNQTGRRMYITPSSFLELVKVYIVLMKNQQNILPLNLRKYSKGIQALKETNQEVEVLQKKIIQVQPILDKQLKENEEMVRVLDINTKEAQETELSVKQETNEAQIKKDEVNELKVICQQEYEEALPTLNAAQQAVMNIDKTQLNIIKSYINPPKLVVTVLEAVCLLFGYEESWENSKRYLLGDIKFLDKLIDFDLKKSPESRFIKLRDKYFCQSDFKKEVIMKQSEAASSIYQWLIAIDMYQKVKKNVDPKEKKLIEAQAYLNRVDKILREKEIILKDIQKKVSDLNYQLVKSQKETQTNLDEINTAKIQLHRAEKLLSGLNQEQERWDQSFNLIQKNLDKLVGNILIAAAYIVFLGPFNQEFRNKLEKKWILLCDTYSIPIISEFQLEKVLSDDNQISEWQDHDLPTDLLSIQNAVIINNCVRYPLIIDPQGQAQQWIKKQMNYQGILSVKLTDPQLTNKLEICISNGKPFLIENVEEWMDPSLDPILQKDINKKGLQYFLKMGDKDIQYNQEFKLFMISRLTNPHFLPELTIKITLINFTVTLKGLEDQLLVEVVKYERNDLETQRIQLIKQISFDNKQLKTFEQTILLQISESNGKILDDDKLINTLDITKEMSEGIQARMVDAKITSEKINSIREQYRGIAIRSSILYFVIAELAEINHMYRWSLDYFIQFYKRRLKLSLQSENIQERIQILIDDMTLNAYQTVCRGLFNQHKLLFSFMITTRIEINLDKIQPYLWNQFVYGIDFDKSIIITEDEKPSYLDSEFWKYIYQLSQIDHKYYDIIDSLNSQQLEWQQYLKNENSQKIPYEKCTDFDVLNILKITHPQNLIINILNYVTKIMGKHIFEEIDLNLQQCLDESKVSNPMIFILSPGADPMALLTEFALKQVGQHKFKTLSLGQGQGNKAKDLISQGRRNGDWICLQNCHLAITWMEQLEKIQEQLQDDDIHPFFRLWLTTDPSDQFSINVLQSGIKIVLEPPSGIKANLNRIYNDIDEDKDYTITKKDDNYQKLLYNLALFHSIIQERKKYGPLGWNNKYDWMSSDFQISQVQLKIYCQENENIPFEALNILIADINYGGRVSDDRDIMLLKAIIHKFINIQVLEDNYEENKEYNFPQDLSLSSVKQFINNLPDLDESEIFGLHKNAQIKFLKEKTKQFENLILAVSPKLQSEVSTNQNLDQIVLKFIQQAEPLFVTQIQPRIIEKQSIITSYRNQEICRFNELINLISNQLKQLGMAIKGFIIMSQEIEILYQNILENKMPVAWIGLSFLSSKPLGSWLIDLQQRLEFFKRWSIRQKMDCYQISTFYFPQGFLTAVKLQYARNHRIQFDQILLECQMQNTDYKIQYLKDGVVIYGLNLEGFSIDQEGFMIEQDYKIIIGQCPYIELTPVLIDDYQKFIGYQCPLYKSYQRAGTQSTTGHSTNYITSFKIKCRQQPEHWTRRGAALLCQADD